MNTTKNNAIILFDGICNLCNATINLVIRHDTKKHFLFAPLQSDDSKELLLHYSKEKIASNSVILIENNKIYTKSKAILMINKNLTGLVHYTYYLIVIPPFIRDAVYDFIAKRRYSWFGKKKVCMIPGKELENRFL